MLRLLPRGQVRLAGRHLWHILVIHDTEPVELFLSLLLLAWAVWLIVPGAGNIGSGETYRVLRSLSGEPIWAVLVLLVGLFQLAGVLIRGCRLRRVAAVLSFGWWVFLALLAGLGNLESTAPALNLAIALAAGWVFLRLGGGSGERGDA